MMPLLESIVLYTLSHSWIEPKCWDYKEASNSYLKVYAETFREVEIGNVLSKRQINYVLAQSYSKKFQECKQK